MYKNPCGKYSKKKSDVHIALYIDRLDEVIAMR